MKTVKLAVAGIAALSLAGAGFTGTAQAFTHAGAPALVGACPDRGNEVRIPGGYAEWDVECNKGKVTVHGYVKDTRPDGKCAVVVAKNGKTRKSAKACGTNKTKSFTLKVGKGKGAEVRLKNA